MPSVSGFTLPTFAPPAASALLPKLCGADFELGNFVAGVPDSESTGREASQLLLQNIAGYDANPRMARFAARSAPESGQPFSADYAGRKFLRNGGSSYIDLWHLEMCLPEVRCAREHVAYTHAMYRLARQAAAAANEGLPAGRKLVVLAENSDGRGHSYGSHLDVLVSREMWVRTCRGPSLHQAYLASYHASSIVFTGLGKVGAENGAPPVEYQISQRANFIETVCFYHTSVRRPLINNRDESHCGSGDMARLHVIPYDSNLCHVAGLLKAGALRIVLSMMEAGWVSPLFVVEDPVRAINRWSHDISLKHREPLVDGGGEIDAVALQMRFFEAARRYVESGACAEVVPDAPSILELWGDTLQRLHARDFATLRRRLDWVLKLSLLGQAIQHRPALAWSSPEIKFLDHNYANLDAAEGLYWRCENQGMVDLLLTDEEIAHRTTEPPPDTRAWCRSRLLQLARPAEVREIDWGYIDFALGPDRPTPYRLHLPNPLRATEAETGSKLVAAANIAQALTALAAGTRPGEADDPSLVPDRSGQLHVPGPVATGKSDHNLLPSAF